MSDTEDQRKEEGEYVVPKAEEYTEHYATEVSVGISEAGDSILIDFQHDEVSPVLNQDGEQASFTGRRVSVGRVLLPPSGTRKLAKQLQGWEEGVNREVIEEASEQAEGEKGQ